MAWCTFATAACDHSVTAIRPVFTVYNFLRRAGPVQGCALLWNPGQRSNVPYMVCTTCHDQHSMNVYSVVGAGNPIAGNAAGTYAKYFFINGPYNPDTVNIPLGYCRFHDPVLPPVPLWRVERSQRRHTADGVLTGILLDDRGRGFFLPFSFLVVGRWSLVVR